MVLWRPKDLLELIPKKDVLFIIVDWNAKVGSQEIPGVTGKFGLGVQNEAGQRLIEFCKENALVIANTHFQQYKRRLYTWTLPDGQLIDYILCSQRWRSSIQPSKTRLEADCGSTHELLIAKFRLKLKEVGKTTRPFRYDLNQTNPLQLYSGSEKRIQGIRSDRQSDWRTTEVRLDDLRSLPHLKVWATKQHEWHAGNLLSCWKQFLHKIA